MQPHKQHTNSAWIGWVITLGIFYLVIGVGYVQRQSLLDWWKMRGYVPVQEIRELSSRTGMTDYGQHLFYVNRPELSTGASFEEYCSFNVEKTIILGCYHEGDRGIYLYQVTDTRLEGVQETTAAHEMLHAAYARLSAKERMRIDKMLQDYYDHKLKDSRVKKSVEQYTPIEPGQLTNEMHSIFATELEALTPELESYYSQYFTDRQAVVAFSAKYEHEFTSRREMTAQYDEQLATLSQEIESNEQKLETDRIALDRQYQQLDVARTSMAAADYNKLVVSYNSAVDSYNTFLQTTKGQITSYNDIVEKRNALALEERDLLQSLSSTPLAQ